MMPNFLSVNRIYRLWQIPHKRLPLFVGVAFESSGQAEIERITRIINDHPYPDEALHPKLVQVLPPSILSTSFVENVLGYLFASHANGLKALEFFRFSLHHSRFVPSSNAFEKTLHVLVRMRYFEKAWELIVEIGKTHPSLLTLKSMSIMLSRIAKFQSYDDTLDAFERMEKIFVGRTFGTEEFNVLLRAFCTQREMKEARSVFQKMYDRFPSNIKTMNILLLGFKESGDITALELFYHEMVRRGFRPTNLTYNIRIDAYCKKGYIDHGMRIFEEMNKSNCLPTLEIITTLIHGAGLAKDIVKAKQLFDEIPRRNFQYDVGAFNALISSLIRCNEVKSAISLMDEMEDKHIEHDNVTYHTIFFGLMKLGDIEGVFELYHKMVHRNFVPKTRTVVMLMKLFCVNSRLDLGLDLWGYLMEKGHCPHGHALDLLATGLCSRGKLIEAFECSKQLLDRGIRVSEAVHRMLERLLSQSNMTDNLRELNQKIKKLQSVLPPSRGNVVYSGSSTFVG